MFVPIGVIGQAAAVAAYPTLARLFAEGMRPELLATVNKALRYVLVLSIGAAGLVAAMSVPAIRVQEITLSAIALGFLDAVHIE